MIRFPNPGSDIPSFIRIFQTLYTYLRDRPEFTLDDMSATLTKANLASSSGHVGEKALALSTRSDRSRDPLYNQSKMYAELYRTLGWIVSDSPESSLRFRFTLLGDHAAIADVNPKAIFEESVLGINYPNQIIAVKGTEASRAFSTILRVANQLDGTITRDEIIVGVLNHDDISQSNINVIITQLRKLRNSPGKLAQEIARVSKVNNIQINTMQNYTRFPLAVMQYCGWFVRITKPRIAFRLTEYGKQRATELDSAYDVRLSEFEHLGHCTQNSLIRLGFYSMLQRANFDLSPVIAQLELDRTRVRQDLTNKDVLFSPYQTILPSVADKALGAGTRVASEIVDIVIPTFNANVNLDKLRHSVPLSTISISHSVSSASVQMPPSQATEIELAIRELVTLKKDTAEIVNELFAQNRLATKNTFYPLVADMFTILGFKCHAPRHGINYERWDAIAVDDSLSVPIEIKPPTEELNISVKAIRQALENKVILLSRETYKTNWDTASLAVGYYPPNNRAEVTSLIHDIKQVFGIKIAVIDFKTLLTLAVAKLRDQNLDIVSQLRNSEGIVHVDNS